MIESAQWADSMKICIIGDVKWFIVNWWIVYREGLYYGAIPSCIIFVFLNKRRKEKKKNYIATEKAFVLALRLKRSSSNECGGLLSNFRYK